MEVKEDPILKKSQPVTTASKPHNAQKYCEFHKQNGHTIAECRELRKALHELTNKGQIDCFLKRGPRFLRKECEPKRQEPSEKECSTEIIVTIAGRYTEDITWSAWKVQLRRATRFSRPNRRATLRSRQWCSMDESSHTLPHPTMTH